jgi:hypothetical protein
MCDYRPGATLEGGKMASGGSVAGVWYNVPELAIRDLYFVVPLDYSSPDSPSIIIFVREVVAGKSFLFLRISMHLIRRRVLNEMLLCSA